MASSSLDIVASKAFGGLVCRVDGSRDALHHAVSILAPLLDCRVLDVRMVGARSRATIDCPCRARWDRTVEIQDAEIVAWALDFYAIQAPARLKMDWYRRL
eukprot:scaffold4929_cov176-Amphora_coffeaeformis.AAC.7